MRVGNKELENLKKNNPHECVLDVVGGTICKKNASKLI